MKWIRYALFIGLLLVLVGCSEKELQEVKIGEVTRSIFYAPLYAAIEKGFFEEEGMHIDLTTIPGGDKTMTALLSDGIDIALLFVHPVQKIVQKISRIIQPIKESYIVMILLR